MALADPDLPAGVALPELSATPPRGVDRDDYRRLRAAYGELPRRSRVVVVLRLPLPDRRPLRLRAIGALLSVGEERVRQLEQHAAWMLVRAWRPQVSPADLTRDERMALLARIVGPALDRYPVDDEPGQ